MCFLDRVYKTFIISTIVDGNSCPRSRNVYKTFIISTIVDPSPKHLINWSIRHL